MTHSHVHSTQQHSRALQIPLTGTPVPEISRPFANFAEYGLLRLRSNAMYCPQRYGNTRCGWSCETLRSAKHSPQCHSDNFFHTVVVSDDRVEFGSLKTGSMHVSDPLNLAEFRALDEPTRVPAQAKPPRMQREQTRHQNNSAVGRPTRASDGQERLLFFSARRQKQSIKDADAAAPSLL